MKRLLFFLFLLSAVDLAADENIFKDDFKSSSWRIVNSSQRAPAANNILTLDTDKPYMRSLTGTFPYGAKYRFSIDARGAGTFKLGVFVYGGKISKLWSGEFPLDAKFTPHEFTFALPESSGSLGLIIQGQGEYRNAGLIRRIDPDYRLSAAPPYQMTSGKPEPVTFTLYYRGKAVDHAHILENGTDAVHPDSGQTAHAYIDKGDTAVFDAAAKDIKLTKPVRILYLGDSLTHFDIGHNHADKTGYFLNKYNPGKAEVWNYACGGDDIERVVQRLDGKAPGRWKDRYNDLWNRPYDWAFVFLGHNDTKASSARNHAEAVVPPEKQKVLYEILIARLKSKGVERIILISPTSSNFELCKALSDKTERVHNRFGDPKHLEAFAAVLKELAQKHHLEYMDIYTPMKAFPGKAGLLNPRDGVHLTAAGHDFIALETLKYLSRSEKAGKEIIP